MNVTTLFVASLVIAGTGSAFAQAPPFPIKKSDSSTSQTQPISKEIVYRHFFAWVDDLDKKAVAKGATDPYEFAKPFKNAGLENADFDAIRKESKMLDSDLKRQDAKAKTIIDAYRKQAQDELQAGMPLPPIPPELDQLQAARSAILVQHMVTLQMALGPDKTSQMDAYMKHAIMPHISLKPLLHPVDSSAAPVQPSTAQ